MCINFRSIALLIGISFSGSINAGIYSDDLSRCLIESSTPSDKATLVKWMFTAMALHPDVASMSAVTPQQRDEANKDAARMFVNLMTETCLEQARKAIRYEGPVAVHQGFNAFGQVAGQELFANPEVAQGLTGLEKHMDLEKLESALGTP
ncbi:MAG: hypothetical protein CMI01_06740 [Oceanospirillaceae bacterium]|nr:hypothetical protein [Oceanospirillaceae bacterium]